MERMPLKMVRHNLQDIPAYTLPTGFHIRFFEDGDELNWSKIETSVNEFKTEKEALAHFDKEFGSHIEEMKTRCLFIENEHNEVIGTTTAWCGDLKRDGDIQGRIHWVGIMPQYQGKKLSKPLLTSAMSVLADYHTRAYLTSQTTSYQAVNMYLNYGFDPYITKEEDVEAWKLLESALNKKILD